MDIAELKVELRGVHEVYLNGVNLQDGRGKHMLEESVFSRELTLDQQHMIICEVRQLLTRMVDVHNRKRLANGELSSEALVDLQRKRIRSGAKGVPGTGLGPLLLGR
jgi:hypothetical protein